MRPIGTSTPRAPLARSAAVTVGAAVLFGLLLALVESHWGPLARLDQRWSASLHRYARGHTNWTSALRTITTLGGPVVMRTLLALAACWLWAIGARTLAAWTAAQALLGWAVEWAAKAAIGRARPAYPDPVAHAAGSAFPSGHAMASAITMAALVVLLRPHANRTGRIVAGALAGIATAAVGFSRIALGVHWPSDVMVGWLLATAVVGGITVAVELWRPGALTRDVRRVHAKVHRRSALAKRPRLRAPQRGEQQRGEQRRAEFRRSVRHAGT